MDQVITGVISSHVVVSVVALIKVARLLSSQEICVICNKITKLNAYNIEKE